MASRSSPASQPSGKGLRDRRTSSLSEPPFDTPSRLRLKALPRAAALATGEVDSRTFTGCRRWAGLPPPRGPARVATLERSSARSGNNSWADRRRSAVDDNSSARRRFNPQHPTLARAREIGTSADDTGCPSAIQRSPSCGPRRDRRPRCPQSWSRYAEIVDHGRSGDPSSTSHRLSPRQARPGAVDRLFAGRRGIEDLYPARPDATAACSSRALTPRFLPVLPSVELHGWWASSTCPAL